MGLRYTRTLTPHEAARIQGFGDDHRFELPGDEPPFKNLLSRWIGDAVPPHMGFAVGLAALATCDARSLGGEC